MEELLELPDDYYKKHNNYNISQYVKYAKRIIQYRKIESVKERTESILHNMLIELSWGTFLFARERERTGRNQQIAKQDLKDHSRAISSHGVPLHPTAKRRRV